MYNEILILVDKASMHTYKGSVGNLENGYTKLGFKLDEKYKTMTFRGNLSRLETFSENIMTYFDEIQVLGKGFYFVIGDSIEN